MTSPSFPEITGNFVPLPKVFLDVLLRGNLSRFELIVTLHLARVTYDLAETQKILELGEIADSCDLARADADAALEAAIGRGTVLPFVTPGESGSRKFYLLNTEENRRVAGVLEAPSIPFVDAMPEPAPRFSTTPIDLPRSADAGSLRTTGRVSPFDRIIALIGRSLTRDEQERLDDLKPELDLLDQAIDKVEAKKIEVYSSDQIIYEYDSIQGQIRRGQDDIRRRDESHKAKERVKSCKKCKGMGYIFLGVSTIEECSCRRTS